MDPTKVQQVYIKFCATMQPSCTGFSHGEKSWICSYDPGTKQQPSQRKSPNSPRLKMVKHVKSKVKSMLIIFFDIKGIVRNEFVLAQSIPHTTSTFYGDRVKLYEGFIPNFGDKSTGCCIRTTHCLRVLFSPGNF
jgi:hypothetical protein